MSSLFILIPISFLLLAIAIVAWLWCVRSGQFDDLDQEASRILFDDPENEHDQDSSSKNKKQAIKKCL